MKIKSIIYFFLFIFLFHIDNVFSQTWGAVGAGATDGPGTPGSGSGGGDVVTGCVVGTDVYFGGWFATIGGVSASRIAKYNGTTFTALGTGISTGSAVFAIAQYGGNIYAGGYFTAAGGVAASNIAMWNPGTSTWSALGTGTSGAGGCGSAPGCVRALCVYGGELYATGDFTSAGGVANTAGIAKWNGAAWSAVSTGLTKGACNTYPTYGRALYVWGANLYVGGDFTGAGGVANTQQIAKWDGTNFTSIANTGTASGGGAIIGPVYAITAYNGKLVLCGTFSRANGQAIYRIAQWDGAAPAAGWSKVGSTNPTFCANTDGSLYCMAVYNGWLLVGGSLVSVNTGGGCGAVLPITNYVARYNSVSDLWYDTGSSPALNNVVYSLTSYSGLLYAGGLFGTLTYTPIQPEHITSINISVLPIELLSFSGSCEKENVILNWSTASEINNNYFTIERSSDGTNFEPIETVQGAGNSSTIRSYEFTDSPPDGGGQEGALYYRLKQTDYNGKYEYFGPISVTCSSNDEWNLILQNIPVQDELLATLLLPEDAKIKIEIMDLQGKIILLPFGKEGKEFSKGSNLLQVDTKNISCGVYFLKVYSNENQLVKKIVKL